MTVVIDELEVAPPAADQAPASPAPTATRQPGEVLHELQREVALAVERLRRVRAD